MNTWLNQWTRWHSIGVTTLFFCATIACRFCKLEFSEQQQLIVALSSVALTGVSHGAVDHLVDGRFVSEKIGRLALFAGYLALVLGVGCAWWLSPPVSLVVFLCFSVIHFGADLNNGLGPTWVRVSECLMRGSLPILIPCYAHPAEVTRYFNMLGCHCEAAFVTKTTQLLMVAFIAVSITWLASEIKCFTDGTTRGGALRVSECVSLGAMCYCLPPLLSFTLYFCALHSWRHILRLASFFDPQRPVRGLLQFCRMGLPVTVISILGAALIFLLSSSALSTAEVKTLFVSLSALTIPHMLLAFLCERFSQNSSQTVSDKIALAPAEY